LQNIFLPETIECPPSERKTHSLQGQLRLQWRFVDRSTNPRIQSVCKGHTIPELTRQEKSNPAPTVLHSETDLHFVSITLEQIGTRPGRGEVNADDSEGWLFWPNRTKTSKQAVAINKTNASIVNLSRKVNSETDAVSNLPVMLGD
jgi:hypothetical protein